LWNLADDVSEINTVDLAPAVVRSVAFSERGALVIGADDGSVVVWDMPATGGVAPEIGRHTAAVRDVQFVGESDRVLSVSTDGSVAAWGADRAIGQHDGALRAVAAHPNGDIVAAAGDDGAVLRWSTKEATRLVPELTAHQDRVWTIDYSPDGMTLASGGDDRQAQIILWQPETDSQETLDVAGNPGRVYTLEFSPDGAVLAAGVDDTVQLWDVETRVPIGPPLTGHRDAVRGLAFSNDGRRLATASPDGTIRIWAMDPLKWIELACAVATRNMTVDEWSSLPGSESYVRHCEGQVPVTDAPADSRPASYRRPADLGVDRQFVAADRSMLIVLIIGSIIAGVYVASHIRRNSNDLEQPR